MAEHWTVAPGVEGSSPFVHPISAAISGQRSGKTRRYLTHPLKADRCFCAPIAQLDRAPDFESVGREFESPWARHYYSS